MLSGAHLAEDPDFDGMSVTIESLAVLRGFEFTGDRGTFTCAEVRGGAWARGWSRPRALRLR